MKASAVLQPPDDESPGFRLWPVRSPLLRPSRLLSLPPGTEMFQFPGLASGIPGSTRVWPLPRAYRSLPRPCASWRRDIPSPALSSLAAWMLSSDLPSREDRHQEKLCVRYFFAYRWESIGRNDAIALFSGQITETHPEFPPLTFWVSSFPSKWKKDALLPLPNCQRTPAGKKTCWTSR